MSTITDQPKEITTLTLPEAEYVSRELDAVRAFQRVVREHLIVDTDFGVIPGTQKPTLLKPGAEKITKLLGLADEYVILDRIEDWDRPLFRYLVKCQLRSVRTGAILSECIGECNSMESRYRWRWLFGSQLPDAAQKDGLVTRTINTRNGRTTQYRIENDDLYSQVNTIVKMAQKRALVGAALAVARLSELFTQDMEDLPRSPGDTESSQASPTPRAGARVVKAKAAPDELTSQEADLRAALESATNAHELSQLGTSVSQMADAGVRSRLIVDYQEAARRIKGRSPGQGGESPPQPESKQQ